MPSISIDSLYTRYQELQAYVGWSDGDAQRLAAVGPLLEPALPDLVADFYQEIERHPAALKVITGGAEQIARLTGTLIEWLRELLSGRYDAAYVYRRWKVGYRHVEIGLDQVFTNVALSRLRTGLNRELESRWTGGMEELSLTRQALDRLLDLDLAIIEDAYQAENTARREVAERLAAIGQVAGGIAHELRNPLNVIKTSVYYLLNRRNPTPEKTAEHLQRIEKQVGLADGVITALSNFAKLPLPNLKPMSVQQCLLEVMESVPVRSDIELVYRFPDQAPQVQADIDQMRIVFSNLIRNAQDAMPTGGQLTLAVETHRKYVDILIVDNGHGMDAATLERIMEPLFTTKARGIGLGLAMANAITEKNNGQLLVQSAIGKGSTFTVRLQPETPLY